MGSDGTVRRGGSAHGVVHRSGQLDALAIIGEGYGPGLGQGIDVDQIGTRQPDGDGSDGPHSHHR